MALAALELAGGATVIPLLVQMQHRNSFES